MPAPAPAASVAGATRDRREASAYTWHHRDGSSRSAASTDSVCAENPERVLTGMTLHR
jgi:hypothetical protein